MNAIEKIIEELESEARAGVGWEYINLPVIRALYEVDKKLESIAKSLDRLHNSQIKPSIKGD